MKKMVTAVLLLLLLSSPAFAENVRRLVLYRDTAYVTVLKDAIAGYINVDVPDGLIQESVIAEPAQAGGVIRSIDVRAGSGLAGKAKEIQDEIDGLESLQMQKKRQQETIEKEIEIIYDAAGGIKKEAALPKARINESIAYIDDKVGALNARHIMLGREREDIKVRIRGLEAQLQGVSRRPGYRISIQSSGPVNVSYALRNMGWKPEYAIQAWPSKDMLVIEAMARLWQSTGTDMTAEEVLVSTGSPSYGIQAPGLSPWHISPIRRQKNMLMAEAMAATPLEKEGGASDEYAPVVRATETSYVIGAAKNVTIPGDGSQRVVILMRKQLTPEYFRVAVPKVSMSAYLRAQGGWQGDVPLAAGEYTAFVDGEYCGRGNMKTVEPGGDLSFDLGTDEGIIIDRKEKTFTERTMTGKDRMTRSVTIAVENTRDRKIAIKVKDQIPLSDDESVKVELKESVPSIRPDEGGILNWDVNLEPKEKIILRFVYTITGPVPGFPD